MGLQHRALAIGTMVVALGAPVTLAAAPIVVPPIVTPASAEHHLGKPIFAELVTPSLATAKPFYAGLFGWRFQDVAGGKYPYAEAYVGDEAVAGLVEKPLPAGEHRPAAWLNFFSTPELDLTAQVAVENGATLLVPPHDVAGRGREALLADPQGAVFGMLASSSGDPPEVLPEPGAFLWRALITTDPSADSSFYGKLYTYQVTSTPDSPGETHLVVASENYPRASMNSLPPDHPNMHPHWLAFVRVDDVTQAVARVAGLGGRILVEPRVDRHGGLVAVVADPSGAPVGLMEWTDMPTTGVTP